MTISFTVSFPKSYTQKNGLSEMAVVGNLKGAPPSALWVSKVRPGPNHCQEVLQLLDWRPLKVGQNH